MPRSRRFVAAAPLCAILATTTLARADAFTVFGFGTSGVGEASARTARADDGTATHYSPGGLALGRGYRAEVGTLIGMSGLKAAGESRPIEDPVGVTAALDFDVPFEGPLAGRIRVGLGTYSLPTSLLHVIVRKESEPFFPYYDNRTQRLVVLPAIAARITSRLGIGIAANTLAGVSGTADVRHGATRTPEPVIDQTVGTVVAPIVGVRFDPLDELHLALTYRSRFSIDVAQTTDAEVGGVPLHVDAGKKQALFDPTTWTLGAAWDVSPSASVEIDASMLGWSAYTGPQFDVVATLPGVYAPSAPQPQIYKNTWTVRVGGDLTIPSGRHDVILRAGAGYEPSMMTTDRQGMTDLVDADKIIGAAGVTLVLRGIVSGDMRVGLAGQVHVLPTRSQAKVACQALPCPQDTVFGADANHPSAGITNPGYPTLSGGGMAGAAAVTVGVDL